jgi:nucleolin
VEFSGQQSFNAAGNGGPAPETSTVFMGNMNFRSDENSIKQFFRQCGNVVSVRIAMNEEGRPKGFAHVEFSSPDEAKQAMSMNG